MEYKYTMLLHHPCQDFTIFMYGSLA